MSATQEKRDDAFRTELLLRELGYQTATIEKNGHNWAIEFEDASGFNGSASSSSDSRFVEIGAAFIFSVREQEFLRQRMEAFLDICRAYGCYFDMQTTKNEIRISLLSKLYFVALNYYALQESCADVRMAAADLTALFDISAPRGKGNNNGHP